MLGGISFFTDRGGVSCNEAAEPRNEIDTTALFSSFVRSFLEEQDNFRFLSRLSAVWGQEAWEDYLEEGESRMIAHYLSHPISRKIDDLLNQGNHHKPEQQSPTISKD